MTLILDGRKARDFYKARLVERVRSLGMVPKLAIIQIGDNRESAVYIEQKKKFGESIGAAVEHVRLPESATHNEIKARVDEFNTRGDVQGIIIQLPLPESLDKIALMNLIDPKKDVDGLTDESQRLLEIGAPRFIPATAKGVMALLDFYKISVQGKNIAVIGRSRLVGYPIALLLKLRGGVVTVCHSKTENIPEITHRADIVVVAVGKPNMVGASYILDGATVIDVGINSIEGDAFEEELPKKRLVGDVDFEAVSKIASAITPVPGGVGPMTVLSLFDNLITSVED